MNLHLLEGFRALRTGPGVIAKHTLAFGFYEFAMLGTAFAFHSDEMRLVSVALMALGFVGYYLMNAFVMRKYPHLAASEGVDVLAYMGRSQGVMGFPDIAEVPSIENPKLLPGDEAGGHTA